jgi:hypothetical protein
MMTGVRRIGITRKSECGSIVEVRKIRGAPPPTSKPKGDKDPPPASLSPPLEPCVLTTRTRSGTIEEASSIAAA